MGPAAAASASAEAEPRVRRCTIRDCECCWLSHPQIPHIAPWKDYRRISAADNRPAWSLLVGVSDGASSAVRVSRLRVARSGRILGRSDDKLEDFHTIVLAKPPARTFEAGAALAPDGRSLWLCVLSKDAGEQQTRALQLSLLQPDDDTKEELPLPEMEGETPCIPISAAGHIWALSATVQINKFRVVTRRLVVGRRWEKVGDPFISPLIHRSYPQWGGCFLQGYAVLPGAVLVSFQEYGLFHTFAPDSGCWTKVRTDATRSKKYLPLKGRAIYMEQHDAVYMLLENTIYAYKLTRHYQHHDQQLQLSLDPPIEVGIVCPFGLNKGYGFLTRLADGLLLCSVWISLAMNSRCPCNDLHAIVTTFHLRDLDQAGGGIEVLHSTYRRVDMVPDPASQIFCFLQEYEDEGSSALPHNEESSFCRRKRGNRDSSQHVKKPSEMLPCCSFMIATRSLTPTCFECGGEGHIGRECTEKRGRTILAIPPLGPFRSLPFDPPSRQHTVPSLSPVVTVNPATTTMKKDLFIICQAGSQAVVFKTSAMDDHNKPLQKYDVLDGDDLHFFESASKICAVPGHGMLEICLNKRWEANRRSVGRTIADPFIMVIRVGGTTIGLTDTLLVYYQTKYTHPSASWLPYETKRGDVRSKVSISGYAVVNDDSFIVYDAVTCLCFVFDMGAKQWRVASTWAAFKEDVAKTNGLLNGRCVFVGGFIYTCRNGGLAAYELIAEHGSEYIRKPIFLPFSWDANCVGKDMCLDYAGEDKDSGAIFFYVLQGGYSLRKHAMQITTVKVKTKRRAGKKLIPAGIDCVVNVMRSLRHKKTIDIKDFDTRCCFAA